MDLKACKAQSVQLVRKEIEVLLEEMVHQVFKELPA